MADRSVKQQKVYDAAKTHLAQHDTDTLLVMLNENRKEDEALTLEYEAMRDLLVVRLKEAGGVHFVMIDGKKMRYTNTSGEREEVDAEILRGLLDEETFREVTTTKVSKAKFEAAVKAERVPISVVAKATRNKPVAAFIMGAPADSPAGSPRT